MASPEHPERARIRQGDRDKAYRPLPDAVRREAFAIGLAAYGRGRISSRQ